MYTFVHPGIQTSTHPNIHASTNPNVHPSAHSLIFETTHSLIHSSTQLRTQTFTHPSMHSDIHSFITHPSMHSDIAAPHQPHIRALTHLNIQSPRSQAPKRLVLYCSGYLFIHLLLSLSNTPLLRSSISPFPPLLLRSSSSLIPL